MNGRFLFPAVLLAAFDYAVSAAPPEADGSRQDERVRRQLDSMFRTGLQPGPNSLARAKTAYESARRLSKGDRRVEYAWGLVLLKGLKHDDAMRRFSSVAGHEGGDAWIPAWKARIVSLFLLKKFSESFESLAGLAVLVLDRQSKGEPTAEDLQTAQWIGRFLTAAELTSSRESTRRLVAEYDDRISPVMDGDLLDWFESGRESVEQEFAILSGKAEDTRSDQEKQQEERDEKRVAEIRKNVDEVAQQQDDTKKLKGDADAWLGEVTTKIEKSLARLEKDYEFLRRQAVQVEQSASVLYQQMALQQIEVAATGAPAARNPIIAGQLNQQRLMMEVRLNQYGAEYSALSQQAVQVADRARGLLNQKQAAIREYEKVTGKLVRQTDELKKWQSRLSQAQEQIEKKKAEAKKRKRTSRFDARLRSIRTFVPLDPDAESRRVLSWFGASNQTRGK